MQRLISALAACCLLACSSVSAQEKSLENLLTDETVFVWSWSGQQSTSEAYQQTASYKAFHESGLIPAFDKLGNSIPWKQFVAASGTDFPLSWSQLKLGWNHLQAHGAAISVGLRGNDAETARPYGLLVIPQAGPFASAIEDFYQRLLEPENGVSDSVARIDFTGLSFPAIQFSFGTPWQPLSTFTPQPIYSGQIAPSPQYVSDAISYFPSNQPAPSVAPASSPYPPATGYGNESPAAVNPALPADAPPQQIPPYSNGSESPSSPSLAPPGEIPGTVAVAETEEPLVAPRPANSWKIEKTTVGEREIFRLTGVSDPDYPNLQFAWWSEGNDLVFYCGLSPINDFVTSLQLEENRLVKSELWQSSFDSTTVEPEAERFTETSRAFINIERIAQLFAGMPIDQTEPVTTVGKLIEPTGLLGLRGIGSRLGYRGQNLVSIVRTVTESPRKGLLSLFDDSTFTLDDLPPLPANVSKFSASAIDAGKTYREVQNIIEQYVKLGGPEGELSWQMLKQQSLAPNGFDIEKDLLAYLGHVAVTYNDSKQEILGWGTSAVAIAVTDPDALLQGINHWRDSVNESFQSEFRILRRERRGYTVFAIASRDSLVSPSFAVSGNWLVIGWQPQTVEAFQLRAAGKLPVWSQDELSGANRGLIPQKFQQLEYSDPRSTVRTMVSLAPWALEGIRLYADQAAQEGFVWNPGVNSLDIPPAELIVEPLYPNLTVTSVSDNVIHTERWASSNVDNTALWFLGAYFGLGLIAN